MRQTLTISLPPAMRRQAGRLAKAEHRTTSELVREALRVYFELASRPAVTATAAELRALQRGRRAFTRGETISLDDYNRELDARPRKARAQKSRSAATA